MRFQTPEQAGISSRNVLAFYKELDSCGLSTHSVILSRGEHFFSECYYAPFHKDFLHRMYSSSKSFVSIAVGFCLQDGLLSLEDPVSKFFPECNPNGHTGTIQDFLQMRSSTENGGNWFTKHTGDRAAFYFTDTPVKYPGTLYAYDSSANFMLGAIVERVTGKPFLKYLQKKVLDAIGFSKDAACLTCPGGHSWSDSGILCTARDLWRFTRFVGNGGCWEGKRYLDEGYIKAATAATAATDAYGFRNLHNTEGYGYQFWGAADGCFATKGMGGQISLYDPAHDFIFVINSDNQGNPFFYYQIYRALYSHIIQNLGDPLPENPDAQAELNAYLADKKLFCLSGATTSPLRENVSGKTFTCNENPMGIRWFRLDFSGETGTFTYENTQGEKVFPLGFGHNVFAKFPQEGYSDSVGGIPCPGNYYDAAFSADWPEENTLRVRVQIIDKYFGNLGILFGFRDETQVTVRMEKTAEHFLNEYKGILTAQALHTLSTDTR